MCLHPFFRPRIYGGRPATGPLRQGSSDGERVPRPLCVSLDLRCPRRHAGALRQPWRPPANPQWKDVEDSDGRLELLRRVPECRAGRLANLFRELDCQLNSSDFSDGILTSYAVRVSCDSRVHSPSTGRRGSRPLEGRPCRRSCDTACPYGRSPQPPRRTPGPQ